MRLIIALGEFFMPQAAGGSQMNALQLAAALRARGHCVALAATLKRKSLFGAASLLEAAFQGRRYGASTWGGELIFRSRHLEVDIIDIVHRFRADAVILHAMNAMPVARRLTAAGLPLVIYLHDVELDRLAGSVHGMNAHYLSNSSFTRDFFQKEVGIDSVIAPPLIESSRYVIARERADAVTFFGPNNQKGLRIAIGLAAACPDIKFEFIESWVLSSAQRAEVKTLLAGMANAHFYRRSKDVRQFYRRSRVLLAPSQWKEAWGRVASEAQVSGIPVLGSRIGGLPEAIGPGGVLVEPSAETGTWEDALRRMWFDASEYSRLSHLALEHSRRESFRPENIVRVIEGVVAQAIRDTSTRSL